MSDVSSALAGVLALRSSNSRYHHGKSRCLQIKVTLNDIIYAQLLPEFLECAVCTGVENL